MRELAIQLNNTSLQEKIWMVAERVRMRRELLNTYRYIRIFKDPSTADKQMAMCSVNL